MLSKTFKALQRVGGNQQVKSFVRTMSTLGNQGNELRNANQAGGDFGIT